jgi:L-ribulokinase
MNDKKYSIGLDFGTETLRTLAVNVETGEETAGAVYEYPDRVINDKLPGSSITLEKDWALQNPENWIEGLKETIPQVLREGGMEQGNIIGVCVTFTSCTILPTKNDGTPLCFLPSFRKEPHAWPKLWKHHAAQKEADEINQLAKGEKEPWHKRYGEQISAEWVFPKALQMLREAPQCYHASDKIIEGGDWIVWMLTGREMRSACQAGYKAMWSSQEGYPKSCFLEKLDKNFHNFHEKLGHDISSVGMCAGGLTETMSSKLGLIPGTPVGVAVIDAHAAVLGAAVVQPGKIVVIMGTSTCHMVLSEREVCVEGMGGVVKDGIVPGYYGYESGQPAFGDILNWVIEYGLPDSYYREAEIEGLSLHQLLTLKAMNQKPGSNGLLALDWLNGNRSILMNANLSGLLLGTTLDTRPEHVYRAMIEATAFGTKRIIEAYGGCQISVDEIHVSGGIPQQNPLVMQIYADVIGKPIILASSHQASALGAAILGAIAAGSERGGYDSFFEAVNHMTAESNKIFVPNMTNHSIYKKIYNMYLKMHDYFGRENPVLMKELRTLLTAN